MSPDLAQVSRDTVQKFFAGKPIGIDSFRAICESLELDWEEIAGLKMSKSELAKPNHSTTCNVDTLVQQMREQIKPYIQQRCGTMRVLNMNQPIELGDIYTDVNILEKLTANRRLEIEELFEICRIEDAKAFDRFGLATITEKRVPGQEAVERHSKLMVLGRPGAGKTTFLKYLAIRCITDALFPDHLPLFVTLKEFAESEAKPDLLKYLEQLISDQDISSLRDVLNAGRAMILLDGLDEVREEDSRWINQQIQGLSERFHQTHIVLTCRIAAKSYTFQQFVEVEVADFNSRQITSFVGKWFREKKPEKAAKFLERLEENEPIKELANSPLLLTLLCLIFEEKNKFKENRAELYGEGIELLLEKWDDSRDIERDQVYKNLSTQRKEDLLSKLALTTFATGNYFFKRREVEHHISAYIRNLPQANSEALEIDSKKVLRSITFQHGLLLERAVNIYSFSHLTFHEYFTAREITLNTQFDVLVQHTTEKHWREVFLLTANMLRNADALMQLMKTQIDRLLADDETLQQFLGWINQKSSSAEAPRYKLTTIRVFYFALASAFDFDLASMLTPDLTNVFVSSSPPRTLALALDLDLARTLDLDLARTLDLELDRILDHNNRNVDLDRKISRILDYTLSRALDRARALSRAIDLANKLVHSNNFPHVPNLNPLVRKLQQLKDELPDTYYENLGNFRQWWQTHGEAWIDQLRAVIIQHRNIGHDWQFSQEQKQLLQQYYDANKLLVECLNSDCYVSREVRQEIEETLLLPIVEIERRAVSNG